MVTIKLEKEDKEKVFSPCPFLQPSGIMASSERCSGKLHINEKWPMPFTEQQVQMMASYNEIICRVYKQVCDVRIADDKRRHDEYIRAQMQIPTEEVQKYIEELSICNPYRDLKMHPREHILRDLQPFYTKFLNKRNKRKQHCGGKKRDKE